MHAGKSSKIKNTIMHAYFCGVVTTVLVITELT